MTGFNIDRFRASLNHRDGILKTNKFEVTFTLPPIFDGDENRSLYMAVTQDQGLWCDAAVIPGLVEQNIKFRRYGYGPLDTAPLSVNFEDIQLRFIADGQGANWRLFHEWRNKIINTNSLKGMWAPGTEQSGGEELYPYETAWQEEYQTSLFVQWYAENGDEIKLIHVNQGYPTAVSPIQLDWGDNGDVARFMVNFSIQDWQYRDAFSNPMVTS
jgi:hypothetical protein